MQPTGAAYLASGVQDETLVNNIEALYHTPLSPDTVVEGDGSTQAKLIDEAYKGEVNDEGLPPHLEKAVGRRRSLLKVMQRLGGDPRYAIDFGVAKKLEGELLNAIRYANSKGYYWP